MRMVLSRVEILTALLTAAFSPSPVDSLFPKDCHDFREDYIECLHHYKEAMRRASIAKQKEHREKVRAELAAQAAAAAKEAAKAAKPS